MSHTKDGRSGFCQWRVASRARAVSLAIAAAGAPAGEGLDPLGPSICVSVWILLVDSRLTRSTALRRNADGQAHPLGNRRQARFGARIISASIRFVPGRDRDRCPASSSASSCPKVGAGKQSPVARRRLVRLVGLPACHPSRTAGYRNSLWPSGGQDAVNHPACCVLAACSYACPHPRLLPLDGSPAGRPGGPLVGSSLGFGPR